jgi:hypothetical protein
VLDQPVSEATKVDRCRADLLAFDVEIAVDFDAATTTASIFLWTSMPAIRYALGLSFEERRACLVASVRVASYRRALGEPHATLNCSLNHARSGPHSCSASTAPLVGSISPLSTVFWRTPIFIVFHGRRPTAPVAEIVPNTPPISTRNPKSFHRSWLPRSIPTAHFVR